MMQLVRILVPQPIVAAYRHVRRAAQHRRNRGLTTEQVFTDLYRRQSWGAAAGEFSSGERWADRAVLSAYGERVATS